MTELELVEQAITQIKTIEDMYKSRMYNGPVGCDPFYDTCVDRHAACGVALYALRIQAERLKPPVALTWDELMVREGKPVYVVVRGDPEHNGWRVLDETTLRWWIARYKSTYGAVWLAYDREPEVQG